MSEPGEGGVIIIKGGSVDLNYDESIYIKDPADPKSHKNANLKITRVVITGDISYDSGDRPGGFRCDITVTSK
ncbi:MAG TPA: hypothetical protein VIF64_06970 [Pyrinomonadaceae bacterium]|jgi:hypothetical protein